MVYYLGYGNYLGGYGCCNYGWGVGYGYGWGLGYGCGYGGYGGCGWNGCGYW